MKTPDYVLAAKNRSFKNQVDELLNKETKGKMRDYCWDKGTVLKLLYEFAKSYKLGVLPDKLVCYRVYVDFEKQAGELGLTLVPVYGYWEFYSKGLDKNSRPVHNFKTFLKEKGYKLKIL